MRKPSTSTIINDGINLTLPSEVEENEVSWGSYSKPGGWSSLVFTGKAVREWIQSKIAALYTKLSQFQIFVPEDNYTAGSGEKIVQDYKTITIKDGEGNDLCTYNTIILRKVAVRQYTLTFNTTFEDVTINPNPMIVEEGNSVTLPKPTKSGKVFLNWTYNSNNYNGGTIFTPTGDTTELVFTANWRDDSANQLNMYSFESQQSLPISDYSSGIETTLTKNTDIEIRTYMKFHYIPSYVPITVRREEFGEPEPVKI